MSETKFYVKKGVIAMRLYIDGEDLNGISVSVADKFLESLVGGMIASYPANTRNRWYVSKNFFKKHYRLASLTKRNK